jgi:hypothetical protein
MGHDTEPPINGGLNKKYKVTILVNEGYKMKDYVSQNKGLCI